MNIYVGNLAYEVDSKQLREAFEAYGVVEDAEVIIDRRRNRSRGYGFVRMASDEEGQRAITALNGSDFHGRQMRVDESQPRADNEAEGASKGKDTERRGNRSRRQRSTARPAREHSAHAERPAQAPAAEGGGIVGLLRRLFGNNS